MTPPVRAFKNAAIAACKLKGVSFTRFMDEYGLEAILIDADREGYSAKELVAHVLAECGVADGKVNKFEVGLLAVIKYLSERFEQPTIDNVQMFRDLVAILNGGGSIQAITEWVNTHYRALP